MHTGTLKPTRAILLCAAAMMSIFLAGAVPAQTTSVAQDRRLKNWIARLDGDDPLQRVQAVRELLSAGPRGRDTLGAALELLRQRHVLALAGPLKELTEQTNRFHQLWSNWDQHRRRTLAESAKGKKAELASLDAHLVAASQAIVPAVEQARVANQKLQLLRRQLERLNEIEFYLGLCHDRKPQTWTIRRAGRAHPKTGVDEAKIECLQRFWRFHRDYLLVSADNENRGKNYLNEGEMTIMRMTNQYRYWLGIHPLHIEKHLSAAVREHCEDMKRLGFFSHSSPLPGKKSPTDRAHRAGYTGKGCGENLYSGSDPVGAVKAWWHSAGHRLNMLNAGYWELGVGCSGMCGQLFGGRRLPLGQYE